MTTPLLLALTGASGAGKTTILAALARRPRGDIGIHHFDSVGVPSSSEMVAQYGSPQAWQAAMTVQWVRRLTEPNERTPILLLEGQMRPHLLRAAFEGTRGARQLAIALVDCDPQVRNQRLCGPRGQPELANAQMDAWAAYLRGQADALQLPILDTSTGTVETATDALEALVASLRGRPAR